MRKIIYNSHYLQDEDIEQISDKVRAIILDGKNIMMVEYANLLMLPGGKVEKGENEKDAIKRELQEELGIYIHDDMLLPFIEYDHYLYHYPTKEGQFINKLVRTKYFMIKTKEDVDFNHLKLSDNEKKNSFRAFKENILSINQLLLNYQSNNPRYYFFKKELEDVFNEFKKRFLPDNKKTMIIGICGKSGCGKSSLAKELVEFYGSRAVHLDIDTVGHSVLMIDEVKDELVQCFGASIMNGDIVDRKKLGEIVFHSRHEMNQLSDITWKYMQIEIDKFLSINQGKVIILDWLLLPITKYYDMCQFKILLDIPYDIRKERAMKRDNITEEAFDLRESASIDFNKDDFDYVLQDNGKKAIKRMVKLF